MTRNSPLNPTGGHCTFFALLTLLCLAGALDAQSIDRQQTRVLSAPHVRPGCFAPLSLVFDAPKGATSARVESVSPGVVLTRQVNIGESGRVETRLPWLAAEQSFVRVIIGDGSSEFTPAMPSRPKVPGFGRVFCAVFSPDVAAARLFLKPGDELTCDFYDSSEAFSDWRMLDSYDAVIVIDDGRASWPAAFLASLREFCSLGGVVIHAGKAEFEFYGSKADTGVFNDLACLRRAFGIGAAYFCSHESLARHPSPSKAIIAALRDHRWLGADTPPSGRPVSRAVSEPHERGWLVPAGPSPLFAPPVFFALSGLLLMITLLVPVIVRRWTQKPFAAPLAIVGGAGLIALGGALQPGPPATAEMHCVEWRQGDIASRRCFVSVVAQSGGPEEWRVELDAEGPRALPRKAPARQHQQAWIVDLPLMPLLERTAAKITLREGGIENLMFRDFAAKARRGQTEFDPDQSLLLDWWLEAFAYRGRDASIAGVNCPGTPPVDWPNVWWRSRGAITVTPLRVGPP